MTPRYEFKYLIPYAMKSAFLEDAKQSLVADENGINASYRITSQYFDSPDYSAYWEKIDGEEIRQKVRLRIYTEPNSEELVITGAFMEIKHRRQNLILKERLRLSADAALAILADSTQLANIAELSDCSEGDMQLVRRLQRYAASPGFRAVNIVTYLREAYHGLNDDRLRLTFDSNGQALPPCDYAAARLDVGTPFIPDGYVIMEIKFNHAIPCWLRDLTIRHHLAQQRFSKYATGCEVLQLV